MTFRVKTSLALLLATLLLAPFSVPAQTRGETELTFPGLTVSNTSWREKDGRILVTGILNNSSKLDWRDVVVLFQGFDRSGKTVLSEEHEIRVVGNSSRQDFSFFIDPTVLPSDYQILPVAGTSVRRLDPDFIARGDVRQLPGLEITTTRWERLDNRIIVTGQLTNTSSTEWDDVTVTFRGFDERGFPVVTGDYKLYKLGPKDRREIVFAVPSTTLPDRGEIGLIDGTPVEVTAVAPAAPLPTRPDRPEGVESKPLWAISSRDEVFPDKPFPVTSPPVEQPPPVSPVAVASPENDPPPTVRDETPQAPRPTASPPASPPAASPPVAQPVTPPTAPPTSEAKPLWAITRDEDDAEHVQPGRAGFHQYQISFCRPFHLSGLFFTGGNLHLDDARI